MREYSRVGRRSRSTDESGNVFGGKEEALAPLI